MLDNVNVKPGANGTQKPQFLRGLGKLHDFFNSEVQTFGLALVKHCDRKPNFISNLDCRLSERCHLASIEDFASVDAPFPQVCVSLEGLLAVSLADTRVSVRFDQSGSKLGAYPGPKSQSNPQLL